MRGHWDLIGVWEVFNMYLPAAANGRRKGSGPGRRIEQEYKKGQLSNGKVLRVGIELSNGKVLRMGIQQQN